MAEAVSPEEGLDALLVVDDRKRERSAPCPHRPMSSQSRPVSKDDFAREPLENKVQALHTRETFAHGLVFAAKYLGICQVVRQIGVLILRKGGISLIRLVLLNEETERLQEAIYLRPIHVECFT